MKILVDENIPIITVNELRNLGHEVVDLRGTQNKGINDENVWQLAQQAKALFITTDKGFVQNRHEKHNGILIIRLKQPNRLKIHQKITQAINKFKHNEWQGLTVVMRDSFHTIWKAKT